MNDELNYAEMLEIPVETVHINKREKRKRASPTSKSSSSKTSTNASTPCRTTLPMRRARPSRALPKRRGRNGRSGASFWANLSPPARFARPSSSPTSSSRERRQHLPARALCGRRGGDCRYARLHRFCALSPRQRQRRGGDRRLGYGRPFLHGAGERLSPADGTLLSVNGDAETGYTVEVGHSDSFSTIVSGLDTVYFAEGDELKATIPMGFSDGEGEVRVMFYSDGSLINGCTVSEDGLA